MKKVLCSMMALSALVTLGGCSKETKEEEVEAANVLEEILAEGELVVATSPDYPAAEFLLDDGTVVGHEVTFAQYIADELGVDLKIETMDFSGTFTAVDTGKADIVLAGLGWKEDREENYELSIGYNNDDGETSKHGLLVPADEADQYKTIEDFAGKTVAAQANSLQEMYAKEQIPDVKVETITEITQGVLALEAGKVDALALSYDLLIGYENTLDGYVAAEPLFALGEDATAGNVVAAKKGETELIEKINEIITKINEEGLYPKWVEEATKLANENGIELAE